jgi:hypothetical protein
MRLPFSMVAGSEHDQVHGQRVHPLQRIRAHTHRLRLPAIPSQPPAAILEANPNCRLHIILHVFKYSHFLLLCSKQSYLYYPNIVVVQAEVPNSSQERRSNGSLHRVFACSAGDPGFDSRLRRISLGCSMQWM